MLYTILRIIFAFIFQVLFRAKTYGKEHLPAEGPVILAANHMSNWDPPLLATCAAASRRAGEARTAGSTRQRLASACSPR